MIAGKRVLEWLEHRAGVHRLSSHPRPYFTRALELSDKGKAFAAVFGRKQIKGYVGFVDLVGFSTKVMGLRPSQVAERLRPFISGVINEAFGCGALVDKTIGDEVMFIVPDMGEDGGVPAIFEVRHLLARLHDLQRGLRSRYPFRIGLSYGGQFVDRVAGKGYAEWTIVGESVNLAKRLHKVREATPDDGIGGAFGVLKTEIDEQKFRSILEFIVGLGSPMKHQVQERTPKLKGISPARCAILSPKVPLRRWRPGMKFD
jgi:class 3 adenylate cyclase